MCLASAATTVVVSFLGSLTSIVKRLWRSTSVTMCVSLAPVRRSPSQWPGTARSSASAGRADRDHIEYVPLSILGLAAFGVTHLPPCTQLCRQLLLQHAARLNKETAIDRFVRYPHVSVGRELLLQPTGDLLWRPLQRKLLRHAPS